jgi:hypothetical protein
LEVFLFWVGLSIVVAVAAKNRGRSTVAWLLLALVISPLLAGLLLLALPKAGTTRPTYYDPQAGTLATPPEGATKICPDCAETVKAEARICRFCRHEFNGGSSLGPAPRARLPLALTSRSRPDC